MSNYFKIIKGDFFVLLSAGHACSQIRKGIIKKRDSFTGRLTKEMCEQTRSFGLISTKKQIDPNWYPNSPFRKELKELININNIHLVLDIHGKKDDGESIIDFFPNSVFKNTNLLIFPDTKIKKFINDKQYTIAEELDNLDVACIQIEISRAGRLKGTNEYTAVREYIETIIKNAN